MIETGQYQNNIPSLSALSVIDYERIFKIFQASLDNKNFYYYNILKKIEFPVLDDQYVQYHYVKAKSPLTTISYDIYGDIKSWWILYLLNTEKFKGAPFYVNGGVELKYITNEVRTAIYSDITQATIFGGRHF